MARIAWAWVILACAAAAVVVVGCTVGPDYRPPRTDLPGGFTGTGLIATTNPTSQPSVATTRPAELTRWWANFQDPELDSLISRALVANYDLRRATARIRQSRAVLTGARAGLFPAVDAVGSYRRSYTGPGSGSSGSRATTRTSGAKAERDAWQAGFDASWEIDVFGGVRRGIEAATADVESAIEDRRDVLVTLLGDVATNYIALRGFQQRIAIAQENLDAQRHTVDLTRQLFGGGLRAGLDVVNAESVVANTAAAIPSLEGSAQQTIYALSILLGQEPASLLKELSAPGLIPPTPPEIPVGLPSELLRRRPDIRRAERQLAAATARIGVATADLFPRFTLTGNFTIGGNEFESLGNYANRSWGVGPSVSWPIIDFGRIRANIEASNAFQEELLYGYEQAVLLALNDVESALVAYGKEQQHRRLLAEAVAANRRALDLATQLYAAQLTDFLNVLEAQRALYGSQDALVVSDRAVSTNLVALYKALGGGWEGDVPPAPATMPAH